MRAHFLAAVSSGPVDLNQPGTYLHWSIFEISVANLIVIAVMVVIFGAALLIPFPRGHVAGQTSAGPGAGEPDGEVPEIAPAAEGDERMWTARVRRRALRLLPPGKLLPDRQPAYVASWVYVFGVATLAALGLAIVCGFAIAIGGTDWWHTNPVGHFFNSVHLWSVELFMAFMVIHLWGKFWMAAWRGRRAMTWITGVVAFGASVAECFTGYLSQQNFDSQWIATNGKDAFNAVGIGAFFNVMNFGQMLLWHVVLMPHRADRAGGRARPAGPGARGQPPAARTADPVAGPGRQEGRRGRRRRAVARPEPPLRHPQGRHDRDRGRPAASCSSWRACCPRPTCRR